jgi:hypothetical protein
MSRVFIVIVSFSLMVFSRSVVGFEVLMAVTMMSMAIWVVTWRNMSVPSSELKSKPRKKPTETELAICFC